ncbi:hypothetical protein VE03_06973 [Pseudogymnoascus sp. 23342-1-I1]|nr:hypothetical protein VE03_06973 [Pseudogymnoascus sp. 23342-1-I1]
MIVGGFHAVATRRKGPAGNAREDQQGIAPDGEGDNQDQQIVKEWELWSANEGDNWVEKSAASVPRPMSRDFRLQDHWMFRFDGDCNDPSSIVDMMYGVL